MPFEVQRPRAQRARIDRYAEIAATVCAHFEKQHPNGASLAELALLLGVTPCHVSRAFRRAMGLPPHAYLSRVRVAHACALLERGVSLAAVTHETGFFDQSHFSRTFKRIIGVPPGKYARHIEQCSPELRSA
jgi:AraC-like DNA-binding protein